MKAVIYCRFSPRRNEDLSESNETQLDYCRKHCLSKGYAESVVFSDDALSGDDENRPGLWAAVEALERGDVLLAYKADRLARSVFLDETIRRMVAKKGARVEVVVGDTGGDSPQDVLMRQVLSAFAEFEKKVIAARTKAAMLRHQETGRMMGSQPPYGWEQVADKVVCDEDGSPVSRRWMARCPQEQEAIERIMDLHSLGIGPRAIARALNDAQITCRDHDWSHVAVMRIVTRQKATSA